MYMLTTNETLFGEALDRSVPALADIDVTFREKGLEAAEKQLADYIRASLRTEDYFTVPYHDRENVWCDPADSELAAAEKVVSKMMPASARTTGIMVPAATASSFSCIQMYFGAVAPPAAAS